MSIGAGGVSVNLGLAMAGFNKSVGEAAAKLAALSRGVTIPLKVDDRFLVRTANLYSQKLKAIAADSSANFAGIAKAHASVLDSAAAKFQAKSAKAWTTFGQYRKSSKSKTLSAKADVKIAEAGAKGADATAQALVGGAKSRSDAMTKQAKAMAEDAVKSATAAAGRLKSAAKTLSRAKADYATALGGGFSPGAFANAKASYDSAKAGYAGAKRSSNSASGRASNANEGLNAATVGGRMIVAGAVATANIGLVRSAESLRSAQANLAASAPTFLGTMKAGLTTVGHGLMGVTSRVTSMVADAAGKIASLGKTFAKAFAAGGAAAIGFGLYQAGKHAIDMESKLAKLNRASETTDAQFTKLADDLARFGSYTSGLKLDNLYEIATIGAKMGIEGDQLNLFTRDLAKVSITLHDIPIEEATNRIARLLSVFHRGTDEAIRMASAVNKLDIASTATGQDILDISARMAGQASFLGMSPEKTLALAATMKQAGINTETAGTSMSDILSRMASKKHASHFAKLAGQDKATFLKGMTKDPLAQVTAVAKGVSKMDPIAAEQFLDTLNLHGQRTRNTMLLLSRSLGNLDKFVKMSEDDWRSLASVTKGVNAIGNTTAGQWEKVRSNFALTAAELGKGLLPMLKGLAEGLVNLMGDIRASIERNQKSFVAWGESIGGVLRNVGALWRAWPLYVEYAQVVVSEKMEQLGEIIRRVAAKVWANLTWGMGAAITLIKNTMMALASFLTELIGNLANSLGDQINNAMVASMPKALAKTMGLKAVPVRPVAPGGGHFDNLTDGIAPAPGFGGILAQPLPNRNARKLVLGLGIGVANEAHRGEVAKAKEGDEMKDKQARAQAAKDREVVQVPRPGQTFRAGAGITGGNVPGQLMAPYKMRQSRRRKLGGKLSGFGSMRGMQIPDRNPNMPPPQPSPAGDDVSLLKDVKASGERQAIAAEKTATIFADIQARGIKLYI